MRELTITKNDANQRLDKFLLKYLPSMPKSMLYKSLRKKCVRINGKHICDGARMLKEGDVLRLYFKDEFFTEKREFIPVKAELDIVYEDENLLLVNKKAGAVVHADDRGAEDTLIDMIKSYLFVSGAYDPAGERSFSPALCNRLDRNTSGIIIAAKNASALREINEKIRLREVRKYYLCIAQGIIEGSGALSGQLTRLDKRVKISDTANGSSKEVRLSYRALAHKGGNTLLEAELLTGRTHQIRAQLAAAGHPLLGDVKYGGDRADGMYRLHSCRLEFEFKDDGGVIGYLNHKRFRSYPEWALPYRSAVK